MDAILDWDMVGGEDGAASPLAEDGSPGPLPPLKWSGCRQRIPSVVKAGS